MRKESKDRKKSQIDAVVELLSKRAGRIRHQGFVEEPGTTKGALKALKILLNNSPGNLRDELLK